MDSVIFDGNTKDEAYQNVKSYLIEKNYIVFDVNLRGLEGIAILKQDLTNYSKISSNKQTNFLAIRIFEKKKIKNSSNRSLLSGTNNWVWGSSRIKEQKKFRDFDDVELGFWIK